jgi:hypothetical protein
MGNEIHTNRILAGKPERRRKFGRPERKREDVCWVRVFQSKEKRWIPVKKSYVTSRLIKWVNFLTR